MAHAASRGGSTTGAAASGGGVGPLRIPPRFVRPRRTQLHVHRSVYAPLCHTSACPLSHSFFSLFAVSIPIEFPYRQPTVSLISTLMHRKSTLKPVEAVHAGYPYSPRCEHTHHSTMHTRTRTRTHAQPLSCKHIAHTRVYTSIGVLHVHRNGEAFCYTRAFSCTKSDKLMSMQVVARRVRSENARMA